MLQGALGVTGTGMLFAAAYFSKSCRPWKRSVNSLILHGAMTYKKF